MSDFNLDTGGIIEHTVFEHIDENEFYFIRCVARHKDTADMYVIVNRVFIDHPSQPGIKIPFGNKYAEDDIAIDYDEFIREVHRNGRTVSLYREISLQEMNEVADIYKTKYPIFLRFRNSFKDNEDEED